MIGLFLYFSIQIRGRGKIDESKNMGHRYQPRPKGANTVKPVLVLIFGFEIYLFPVRTCYINFTKVAVIQMILRFASHYWYTQTEALSLHAGLRFLSHVQHTWCGAHLLSRPPNLILKYYAWNLLIIKSDIFCSFFLQCKVTINKIICGIFKLLMNSCHTSQESAV